MGLANEKEKGKKGNKRGEERRVGPQALKKDRWLERVERSLLW